MLQNRRRTIALMNIEIQNTNFLKTDGVLRQHPCRNRSVIEDTKARTLVAVRMVRTTR